MKRQYSKFSNRLAVKKTKMYYFWIPLVTIVQNEIIKVVIV